MYDKRYSFASERTVLEKDGTEGLQTPEQHGESNLSAGKDIEGREYGQDDWESDPANARNWSAKKKWTAVSVVSLYCLVSPLASSTMAPGLPEIAVKYAISSKTTIALTLCVFLLSFGIGPLVLCPLSEMYGRTWVLHISNLAFLGFNLGCAWAPTTSSLIGLRFLAGLAGSAPVAIGGGSIGDLFSERNRASAMAIFTLGPLLGPVIGPIVGGFVTQEIGVKYVFIIVSSLAAVASAFGIPTLRETYAPIIRLRRARKEGPEAVAKLHATYPEFAHQKERPLWTLWINLSRPVIILCTSVVCFLLSLYMAFMFGVYYLMFTTFASFFAETYGFKAGVGGLTYLGLGVGFFSAAIFGSKTADQIYNKLASRTPDGKGKPEFRLPALIFGSLFVPIGIFWYGWSADQKAHWILPILGTAVFAFGMMSTFLPIQLYLVDTFKFAASATAAASLLRSLLGFAFPLFSSQMFDELGIGGGNSLLAGLAIVLGIPFPIGLYYYGERWRAKNKRDD
ncbi:multidrug resistance protein 4 [Atractiella rhizophila]|nr:multidrug resistance protein 4 [Atractiella rhizophila]